MHKQNLFFIFFGVFVFGCIAWLVWQNKHTTQQPVQDDTTVRALAQCIKESGAVFYGAFWCPHCQEQKALFGSAVTLLPYTECSTLDGKDQTQVCKDAHIMSYPTWRFKDNSELLGAISLETLAEKTGCPFSSR